MNKLYTLFFLSVVFNSFAQNEFYNNGAVVYVNGKLSTSVATLRVNGTITNNNGSFTNSAGLIELAGNWVNTSSTNYYVSTGIERFTDTFNQSVSGTWNGTSSNQNQFYDLKLNKIQTRGQTVSILQNTNVNVAGTLEFESTNGIIRTDNSSHTNDGSLYANYLFLQNPDPTKLIGNSWTAVPQFSNTGGATTKYIEGKLKLAVSSSNSYKFPVGVDPTYLDGMEGISVAFNSTFTTTALLAYIQPAATPAYTSDLITNGKILFYDIGSLPATSPANQFPNCVGTPDGHDDVAVIDAAISHEWILTPDASTSAFDVSVHPGSILDNLSYVAMGAACNSVYPKTKYLANAGRIGGDAAVGPTTNFWVPGVQGLYQKPNGNLLTGQTSFSRIRLFGTTNAANTSLPVELENIEANAINNEYIKVSWITASEINCKGYIVERSTNGSTFDSIGWIAGNGTSTSIHNYFLDDHDVEKGVIYYYRLKQVDFNNIWAYSRIVSAELILAGIKSITIFPNPSTSTSTIQILSSANDEYSIEVFNDIGQDMYSNSINVTSNVAARLELPSNEWAKGMYIIRVQSSNKSPKGIKFIKE